MRVSLLAAALCICVSGCNLMREPLHEPRFHNPFPQLSRVAVLPFFNQSGAPTLNGLAVANAYRNELQKIPGFEVMPLGVVETFLKATQIQPTGAAAFQQLARQLNVDAVIVGSITDFNEYYPPRMGLAVNWYAANPCFHPIPPGYGLPWGTAEEEFIPDSLVLETEFTLARAQMKTQTPIPSPELVRSPQPMPSPDRMREPESIPVPEPSPEAEQMSHQSSDGYVISDEQILPEPHLPHHWPNPKAFIPPPPSPTRPACVPHDGPIIELIRQYNANDSDFTDRLADYYKFKDDERAWGWRSYLQRKEDFITFCCYLHITELLAARGGAGETRVVWQRPDGRYDR